MGFKKPFGGNQFRGFKGAETVDFVIYGLLYPWGSEDRSFTDTEVPHVPVIHMKNFADSESVTTIIAYPEQVEN